MFPPYSPYYSKGPGPYYSNGEAGWPPRPPLYIIEGLILLPVRACVQRAIRQGEQRPAARISIVAPYQFYGRIRMFEQVGVG